ncbi:MAG: D-galactarate dehydratase [Paracoccaceae bacterium]
MRLQINMIRAAASALALAGCADQSAFSAVEAPEDLKGAPPTDATTVEQFDTTTVAERQAALVPTTMSSGEREIGHTIASLGNPAIPGFWLETPLVSVLTKGRVLYRVTGKSVAVDLIPTGGDAGSGSRISLPALRLLGAALTGLPELIVYAG